MQSLSKPLLAILLLFFGNSCITTKDARYFDEVPDTTMDVPPMELDPTIKPNDILSIRVSSLNPEASEIFNTPNQPPPAYIPSTATTTNSSGYLVSPEGNIQFPVIGNIQVVGLTKQQLKEQITKLLVDRKLLVDPIVDVRYLNFRVSVIGEVAKPSVVTVPSEKITIFEALALAGDLTIYARRDNVLLIRDEDGKRMTRRIDLNSRDILRSPYYFLKSNDLIYVEPNKSKVASSRQVVVWLPVIFSFLSFAIIVADRAYR